ncbi:MAG: amidase [Candidatus Rokuibacteriota bacterium]|nr:MAG: amidase [Candidatus Rokubacteria bacterium]
MRSAEPASLGVRQAVEAIRARAVSPVELVDACLARIAALDGELVAWAHVDADGARAVARERESEARAGRLRGPLHGVPVGVKDIFDVAGMPTTGGARPFAHTRPTADAAAVARIRAAGAIVLGKTVTTEFAYRDPAPTRNPWNPGHTPGGSSAGSAAAVAARMAPLALGSQTVGSVLRPAAYCGVVGFKGTHGLVPVQGVIPLAWSLDHVGVLTRSVADAALAMSVLTGLDLEPSAVSAPRLALAPELVVRASREVAAHIEAIIDAFARAGATVSKIELPPLFRDLPAAGLTVLEAEAAAYHEARFLKHADEYSPQMRSLVEAGLGVSATAYVSANRLRLAFRDDVMPLLSAHDALLGPTAPAPAPSGLGSTGDGSLCAPWSNAGVPAISLPSGVASSGLPHAIQLVQAAGASSRLLGVAAWCERVLEFTQAPVSSPLGRV